MKGLFKKLIGAFLGLTLATSVGFAVATGSNEVIKTEAADSVAYTLTPANGSNNSYAGNCDITINGITWNLTGNSQMQPWRIGGKSLTNADKALYSKTALNSTVSKIEVTHGTAASVTVNSWTVIVDDNSDFSSPISTLTPTFQASTTTTISCPTGVSWSNCYYKFVYNITISVTSNKFLQFTEAKFYGTEATPTPDPEVIECDVATALTAATALDSGATSTDIYQVTGLVKEIDYAWTSNYGVSFLLVDSLNDTDSLYVYQWKCTQEEAALLLYGTEVVLQGKLKNYNGTYELVSPFTKISISGGEAWPATSVTVAEALSIAQALAAGKQTSQLYIVSGYIISVNEYSSQYSNIDFVIADNSTDTTGLTIYRWSCTEAESADVVVGNFAVFQGQLKNYNNTTYELVASTKISITGQNTAEAFATTFLASMTCDSTGATAPVFTKTWAELKTAYQALPGEEQDILEFASANENGTTIEQAMARYNYLVAKYGYENFISRTIPSLSNRMSMVDNNQVIIMTVAIVVSLSLTAAGTVIFVRKRKLHR